MLVSQKNEQQQKYKRAWKQFEVKVYVLCYAAITNKIQGGFCVFRETKTVFRKLTEHKASRIETKR